MELDSMVDALCRQPRMREMMENLQEAVVIVDSSGKIWDYNSQFRQLAGMSQSGDPAFKNLFGNFPFESAGQKHNLLLESIATLEPKKSSWVRYESPTGEKYVNIAITPFHDKSGAQIGLYDVTAEVLEATIDGLTELYTQSHYLRKLRDVIIEQSIRSPNGNLGIIGMDIKGLKFINDKISHSAGSELLKQAAKAVRKAVRKSEYAVREGGDEIYVFVPGAEQTDIDAVNRRMETNILEYNEAMPDPRLRIRMYKISLIHNAKEDQGYRSLFEKIDQAINIQKGSSR